eukprot:c25614_g1_i1 orf=305-2899(+)
MPTWFGSKSIPKGVKKKKSLDNIFDGAKRRFQHFKVDSRSPTGRRHSTDSGSESGSCHATVACPTSFNGNRHLEPQPHPLPCAPPLNSGRIDSGNTKMNAHEESFPSMPLPSPEQTLNSTESTEREGCAFGYGSRSASSASSQGSIDTLDMWQSNGASNVLPPPAKSPYRDPNEKLQQIGFGTVQSGSSLRQSTKSSKRENSGQSTFMLHQPVCNSPQRSFYCTFRDAPVCQRNNTGNASDSPSLSPRRVHSMDQLSGNDVFITRSAHDTPTSGVGVRCGSGFGFNATGNCDTTGHLLHQQGRVSPELSPNPSPKGRSPSSRIQSTVVSPLHPGAACLGNENGSLEGHPLPLPPNSYSGLTQTVTPSPPCIPRSPGRTNNLVHLASGWAKGSLLGSGTFGQVYAGFHSETGLMCAIKEVLLVHDDEKSMESAKQLAQEISLLSQMRHPNIVQYYGTETIEDRLYIYIEYMSGGSIHKLLQQYGAMPESCIRGYSRQILSGLAYLHSKNTVHRDIKGANILVDKGGVVKLADFGMAKHISAQSFPLSFKGSPYWMAPEVIKNENGYDVAVDIWSLGCTILEMVTGKPPWSQYEGVAAMFKIGSSREIPDIPEFLSDDGNDFIRSCLQRNPRDRPSAAQLLEHPFLNSITRQVGRSDSQLDVLNGSSTGVQALSINENRCHSKNTSKFGHKSVSLSPSSSPKLPTQSGYPLYGTLSPSTMAVPFQRSGCSSPLTKGHGCNPHSPNGALEASSVLEAYSKYLKLPNSPNGRYESPVRTPLKARTDIHQAATPPWQTPDCSPRCREAYLSEDDLLAAAWGGLQKEIDEECHRLHGPVWHSGHVSERLRSPRKYSAMQFHGDKQLTYEG